jgi:thioredoxin-related protein
MRTWILLLILGFVPTARLAAGSEVGLHAGMVNPGFTEKPVWFKNSFLDIREDVAEAAEADKRVILYFYQDGCPYCAKLIGENFADKQLAEQAQTGFDIIAINLWGDREVTNFRGESVTEKVFSEFLRVQFTPTLLFLNEQGRVLLRINGYVPPHQLKVALDYVAGKHERAGKFSQFLSAKEPVAASGKLHAIGGSLPQPLRLADNRAASSRYLAVFFEQRQCAACDQLHADVLRRREVATSLTNMDVAQVDMFSTHPVQTPDGRMLTGREWARELGVHYAPTIVFFDPDGAEVFRAEAFLKSFHVHGGIDYVLSGGYQWQPNFQRYLQARREALEARGFEVDLMD